MTQVKRGMAPNEIRAAMVLRGITTVAIANECGCTQSAVSQVINRSSSWFKGYRIRQVIANRIGKETWEIWEDEEPPKTA